MQNLLNIWQPRILSILRIITAFLFMPHGVQKMFGFPLPQLYPFELFSLSGIAGTLEIVCGALILIGFFTRYAAFLLSGMMCVGYFLFHAPSGFWPLANGGELATLYSFLFLYLCFAGGGEWSIDRLLSNKRLAKKLVESPQFKPT